MGCPLDAADSGPRCRPPIPLLFSTIAEGNYGIIHLSADCDVAMIGEPERKDFRVLARQSPLPDERYRALVDKAERLGFPVGERVRNSKLTPTDTGKEK